MSWTKTKSVFKSIATFFVVLFLALEILSFIFSKSNLLLVHVGNALRIAAYTSLLRAAKMECPYVKH